MAFRFETLKIWQDARALAKPIYLISAKFPRQEDYGLKSQINRAVNSISLNIAEGSAKTDKSFGAYLDIAIGSAYEVVGCSFLAKDRGYITEVEHKATYAQGEDLARKNGAFWEYAGIGRAKSLVQRAKTGLPYALCFWPYALSVQRGRR